jgi:hypothetical protein
MIRVNFILYYVIVKPTRAVGPKFLRVLFKLTWYQLQFNIWNDITNFLKWYNMMHCVPFSVFRRDVYFLNDILVTCVLVASMLPKHVAEFTWRRGLSDYSTNTHYYEYVYYVKLHRRLCWVCINEYHEFSSGGKGRPARRADNPTANYEPTV